MKCMHCRGEMKKAILRFTQTGEAVMLQSTRLHGSVDSVAKHTLKRRK
jgi:hypothetical protein